MLYCSPSYHCYCYLLFSITKEMDKISNERKAQIFYQGNGTQTQYSFPFDYLRKAFVHVSLISDEKIEELTQGTDYTVTDRVVTLAAATSLKIKIYRQTATKPLVGWADASVLRAADMTVQSTQLLHLAEETSDLAQEGGLSKDGTDNIWDARYNKIKNLLDPTEPGDAVTLSYITKNQDSLLTQLRNTGAAQNSSIVSTGDTQNARLTSTGDTQNTRLNTTGDTQDKRLNALGQKYVDLMTTLKNTATDKAAEATNQAALAKKWAVSDTSPDGATDSKSAKTWAENAKAYASSSASSASASASSATASQTSASNSASSASTASQKASAAASSASAASSSASNATTSAGNAKKSETNAANSAAAAKASADRAATFDPSSYYMKTETYTREEVDNKIKNNKPDLSSYYTKTEVDAKIPTKTSQLTNDSGFITAADAPKVTESSGEATSNTSVVTGAGKLVWDRFGNIITLRMSGTIKNISIGYGTAKIFSGLPKPKSEVVGLMAYGDNKSLPMCRFLIDTNGDLWIPGTGEDYQTFARPRSFIIAYATKD